MAFKMKPFSGFGNSPMKQRRFIRTPEGFDHKAAKKLAKQEFKKHGAKSGHGRMVDGKIVKASKNVGKNILKQGLKRLGLLGTAMSIYDVAKTAKKSIPGLKRRAKSGNVNIGRKI